jgi:hypothetical protein
MQHHIPITLKKINILPDILDSNVDPDIYTGFCRLVRLFIHIENRLVQLPSSSETGDDRDEDAYSRKRILDIQEQIHCNGIYVSNVPETQCVDLLATSAWLRSLVWQYSASHFMLSTLSPDKPFCPTYPFAIARDFLGFLSGVSDDSIRAHGYGMVGSVLFYFLTPADIHCSTGNQTASGRELPFGYRYLRSVCSLLHK